MEAPNKIWYEKGSYPCATDVESDKTHHDTKYIRADIVAKLKRYLCHSPYCPCFVLSNEIRDHVCTCGLTEVLKEMDG